MRTTVEENRKRGEEIGGKAAASTLAERTQWLRN